MPIGVIVKGIGGFYYVKVEHNVYECKARGIFRKENITPLTGDKVEIAIIDDEKKIGNLNTIFPRESVLVRPSVANVNFMVIILAIKCPSPDFLLLDKLLISAHANRVTPVLCINKIDLIDDEIHKDIANTYKKSGYRVIFISALEGKGFEQLNDMLKDNITVFAGQSGVGKSTIFNKVLNSLAMETGEISKKNERGKHTTRHTELIELKSGGYVLDTPGFSSFELAGLESKDLEYYYSEFSQYEGLCRFKGCSHISEPNCAVKEGLLKGAIDEGRYFRYTELYNSLKNGKKLR